MNQWRVTPVTLHCRLLVDCSGGSIVNLRVIGAEIKASRRRQIGHLPRRLNTEIGAEGRLVAFDSTVTVH